MCIILFVFLLFFGLEARTHGKRICNDAAAAVVAADFDGVNPYTEFRINNRINVQFLLYLFVITYIQTDCQSLFHGSSSTIYVCEESLSIFLPHIHSINMLDRSILIPWFLLSTKIYTHKKKYREKIPLDCLWKFRSGTPNKTALKRRNESSFSLS